MLQTLESIFNKFVTLKSLIPLRGNKALSIGTKIYILQDNNSFVIIYDVDKDEWSKEPGPFAEKLIGFTCVKLPSISLKKNNNQF